VTRVFLGLAEGGTLVSDLRPIQPMTYVLTLRIAYVSQD
jgi:hypothetical protein